MENENNFGDLPYHNVGRISEMHLPPVLSEAEELRSQLAAKDIQIAHVKDELYRTKNSVKDVLVHLITKGDVATESAEYILEAIGLDTKVTKRISGLITFSGELELSIFDDLEYLSSYDFDIDSLTVSNDYVNLTNLDYNISDVEFED